MPTWFCLLTPLLLSAADSLERQPLRWRFSGEEMSIADGERFGLVGLHLDALEALPWGLHAGIGSYSAVSGDRGGLFVIGPTLGWRSPGVGPLAVEINAFAGGGGGASAGQGDGLLMRGEGLLSCAVPGGTIAAGYVRGHFSGTDLDSDGLTLGLTIHDETALLGTSVEALPAPVLSPQTWRLAPRVLVLHSHPDDLTRSGQPLAEDLVLVGISLERGLGNGWWLPLQIGQLAGAHGGSAAGYLEALIGLGWSPAWRLRPLARMLVGAGGGGNVDTGGGAILRPEAGFGIQLTRQCSLEAVANATWAPDGDWHAPGLALALAMDGDAWQLTPDSPSPAARPAVGTADPWRLTISDTTYLSVEAHDPFHAVGFLVEKPFTHWLAGTGRARAAWSNDTGGYSEGLLGAHLQLPLDVLRFGILGEIGAAGGGGVPIGGGLIADALLTAQVDFSQHLGVHFEGGRVAARNGDFAATVVSLGLTVRFERLRP